MVEVTVNLGGAPATVQVSETEAARLAAAGIARPVATVANKARPATVANRGRNGAIRTTARR